MHCRRTAKPNLLCPACTANTERFSCPMVSLSFATSRAFTVGIRLVSWMPWDSATCNHWFLTVGSAACSLLHFFSLSLVLCGRCCSGKHAVPFWLLVTSAYELVWDALFPFLLWSFFSIVLCAVRWISVSCEWCVKNHTAPSNWDVMISVWSKKGWTNFIVRSLGCDGCHCQVIRMWWISLSGHWNVMDFIVRSLGCDEFPVLGGGLVISFSVRWVLLLCAVFRLLLHPPRREHCAQQLQPGDLLPVWAAEHWEQRTAGADLPDHRGPVLQHSPHAGTARSAF